MNKKDVIAFFDSRASGWDGDMVRNEAIISTILDNGKVRPGVRVLDVACGTGVLFPDYLRRNVASVTTVDISPEMVKIAAAKYPFAPIRVICGDVETITLEEKFDCIVIYNAFPHFPDPENLIRVLSAMLNVGGTLTVAHGMSQASIDHHHVGTAGKVSVGLMHEDVLERIFEKYLTVTTKISDSRMYQVTGMRI